MDDSEFDKHFADKMRQAGAPDFSDEDWERLSPVLEAEQRRRWRALPLWWLGVLTLLLLGSNLGWWWMWQRSEINREALRNEWLQVRQLAATQPDTVRSKVVVYQYDTIYRTIVYRRAPESMAAGGVTVLGPQEARPVNTHDEASLKAASFSANPVGQPIANQSDTALQNQAFARSAQNLGILPPKSALLKMPARPVNLPESNLAFFPQQKSHTPRQFLLIPRKFRLGAQAGWVTPSAKGLSESTGFLTALTGELAFSESLALILEGGYSGISFKGKAYDEALGLPPFPSPGDDFVLKHFEVEERLKSIWQLGTGLRYWLRSSHPLSPYLGLGYAAQWHPEFELKLEFFDPVNHEEAEFSIEAPSLGGPVSFLDANAGVRYRFWPQLSLEAGVFYQFKLNANQPGIPRYWGIRSAVSYEF